MIGDCMGNRQGSRGHMRDLVKNYRPPKTSHVGLYKEQTGESTGSVVGDRQDENNELQSYLQNHSPVHLNMASLTVGAPKGGVSLDLIGRYVDMGMGKDLVVAITPDKSPFHGGVDFCISRKHAAYGGNDERAHRMMDYENQVLGIKEKVPLLSHQEYRELTRLLDQEDIPHAIFMVWEDS